MKTAISGLLSSKKAIVCFTSILTIAAIVLGGVNPEHAPEFIDKLTKIVMAYLGSQGLADVGKEIRKAMAAAKTEPAVTEDDNSGQESRASATEEDDEEEISKSEA